MEPLSFTWKTTHRKYHIKENRQQKAAVTPEIGSIHTVYIIHHSVALTSHPPHVRLCVNARLCQVMAVYMVQFIYAIFQDQFRTACR